MVIAVVDPSEVRARAGSVVLALAEVERDATPESIRRLAEALQEAARACPGRSHLLPSLLGAGRWSLEVTLQDVREWAWGVLHDPAPRWGELRGIAELCAGTLLRLAAECSAKDTP